MGKRKRTAAYSGEQVIEGLAMEQHGIVTRAQLLERGLTSDVITGRLRAR